MAILPTQSKTPASGSVSLSGPWNDRRHRFVRVRRGRVIREVDRPDPASPRRGCRLFCRLRPALAEGLPLKNAYCAFLERWPIKTSAQYATTGRSPFRQGERNTVPFGGFCRFAIKGSRVTFPGRIGR